MHVPASSSPDMLGLTLNPVSKQVIPFGIRFLKSNVFPFNLKGLLDTSSAELVIPPDYPPSVLWKIPAFRTNVATGSPQLPRFVKSVQTRVSGLSLK